MQWCEKYMIRCGMFLLALFVVFGHVLVFRFIGTSWVVVVVVVVITANKWEGRGRLQDNTREGTCVEREVREMNSTDCVFSSVARTQTHN